MTIKINKLLSKFTELKPYCHHSKDHDFLEVTQWANGEGCQVHISSNGQDKYIDLTWGEFEALCTVWNYKEGE